MEVIVLPGPQEMAELAADVVARLLLGKRDAVLGLATGSSPLLLYRELARRCAAREVTFRYARGFLLDEYVGLTSDHPQCYRQVIRRELEEQVDFEHGAVRDLAARRRTSPRLVPPMKPR